MELARPAQWAQHSSAWQGITQEGKTRHVGLPAVPTTCTSNLALSHAPLIQPLQCKAAPADGFQGAVLSGGIAGCQVSVDAHSEGRLVGPQVLPPPSHIPVACEEWEGAAVVRAATHLPSCLCHLLCPADAAQRTHPAPQHQYPPMAGPSPPRSASQSSPRRFPVMVNWSTCK